MDLLLNKCCDGSESNDSSFDLKQEKKTLSKIGFAYFILILIMFLTPNIIVFFTGNADMHYILFFNLIAFTLGGLVLYYLLKDIPESDSLKDNTLNIPQYLYYLIWGYGLMMIGYLLTNIICSLFAPSITNPLQSFDQSNIIATFIYAVILGPIFEELFFRKLLISRFAKYGEIFAILTSALLFALYHMNIFQFLGVFLFGIVLAFVYLRTNNIIYVITIHQISNFFGLVVPNLLGSNQTWIGIINIFDLIIMGLAGIFSIYFIFKVKFRDNGLNISKFENVKFFFLNPAIIIFIIFALLIARLNLG